MAFICVIVPVAFGMSFRAVVVPVAFGVFDSLSAIASGKQECSNSRRSENLFFHLSVVYIRMRFVHPVSV